MTTVVLAPDKFKGSLTAAQVAEHLATGLLRSRPDLTVRQVPMADGGEGTVAAAVAAGWTERVATVSGPLGQPVEAAYALSADGAACVVEMALASGLEFTRADVDAARRSSSFGTGELIAHALDDGARRVLLGVGGSASTDGGAGLVQALGARLLAQDGSELTGGGAALTELTAVDLDGLDPRLTETEVVLAADVDNPLLGPSGAAAIYGPQKGADEATVAELESGLARWVQALAAEKPAAALAADLPGAGAAGGLGYAALALLGGTRRSGIEVVIELTGLADQLAGADLAITGEGSLDAQSLYGKTPVGVAAAAGAAGVPTVAVAGRSLLTGTELAEHGIRACYPLTELAPDPQTSIREAGRLLEELAATIVAEHL